MMKLYYIYGGIILDLVNYLTNETSLNQSSKKSDQEKKLEKIKN